MTSPLSIPLTPLCISEGREFTEGFHFISCGHYQIPRPWSISNSEFVDMRSVQGGSCYDIHKQLFENPTVSPQATITDWPNKERRHLGVASNDLLVIALAIECKRCHLPTHNIECYNSPSLVISTQQWNHLDKERMANLILDIVEIFSKTTADIHDANPTIMHNDFDQ